MVSVDGKEMILGTWFTMEHDSTAVVDLPFPGQSIQFDIKQWTGDPDYTSNPLLATDRKNWEQEILLKSVDSGLHISMAYLALHQVDVRTFTFNLKPQGEVKGHLTRQQMAGTLLVHIALYQERSPNFRPR